MLREMMMLNLKLQLTSDFFSAPPLTERELYERQILVRLLIIKLSTKSLKVKAGQSNMNSSNEWTLHLARSSP